MLWKPPALVALAIGMVFLPTAAPLGLAHPIAAAPVTELSLAPTGEVAAATVGVRAAPARVGVRATPTPRPDWGLGPGPGVLTVPILMYHYIRVNPNPADGLGFGLSVTPSNFAAQMGALARAGYEPITPSDLAGALHGVHGLPPRPLLLTFDDGYEDFYTAAAPVLRDHHFRAINYVITGRVGAGSYLTWPQIEELDREGFTFGAHTVNHPDLTRLPFEAAVREVRESKRALEQRLQHPVVDFAYPYGKFTPALEAEAQAAGFTNAVSTLGGSYHTVASLYHLQRISITGRDDLAAFLHKVQLFSGQRAR
jgi:peptidoglycan/xylan/chitin deacetylase (PgdA/CDA1 family)